jgi:flagellar protein FliO/FliZ
MRGNDWNFIGQSFLLVFICVLIFGGTYFISKYISRAKISGKMRGNLGIIEVIGVGLQTTVQLIKAGKKYILIGVSRDRVDFLAELSSEDIEMPAESKIMGKIGFDKYLQKFMNRDKPGGNGDDNDKPE